MTIHAVREPAHEPEWPEVGIQSADFRPTWDGDLVNVWSIVHPQGTRKETESDFQSKAREIARWIIANANQFGAADRFQLILGWPNHIRTTSRQVVKWGGDLQQIAELADGRCDFPFRDKWSMGVFDE